MYCTTPSSFLHHSLPPSLPLFIPPSLTLPSLPPFLPFFNRSSFRTWWPPSLWATFRSRSRVGRKSSPMLTLSSQSGWRCRSPGLTSRASSLALRTSGHSYQNTQLCLTPSTLTLRWIILQYMSINYIIDIIMNIIYRVKFDLQTPCTIAQAYAKQHDFKQFWQHRVLHVVTSSWNFGTRYIYLHCQTALHLSFVSITSAWKAGCTLYVQCMFSYLEEYCLLSTCNPPLLCESSAHLLVLMDASVLVSVVFASDFQWSLCSALISIGLCGLYY